MAQRDHFNVNGDYNTELQRLYQQSFHRPALRMCGLRRCPSFCSPSFEVPPLIQMAGTHCGSDSAPSSLLMFRCTALVVMLWITALSIYQKHNEMEYYLIWLTNWTQLLCLVTATVRVVSSAKIRWCHSATDDDDPFGDLESRSRSLRTLYTVQSILTPTALPVATVVALMYWTAGIDTFSSHDRTLKNINKFQVHGINALLMWMDYLISAELIRFRSVLKPFMFWTIYSAWNIAFEFTIKTVPDKHGPPRIGVRDGRPRC